MGKGWAPCGGRQGRCGLAWWFAGTQGQHRVALSQTSQGASALPHPQATGSPPELGSQRKGGEGAHAVGVRSRTPWWNRDCTRSPVAFRKAEAYVSSSLEFGICGFYPVQWELPGTPRTLGSTPQRVWPLPGGRDGGRTGLRRWEEPSEAWNNSRNPLLPSFCLTSMEVLSYFLGFAFLKNICVASEFIY